MTWKAIEKQIISKINTLKNENEFLEFIEKNHGSFFRYIPLEHRTFEVCKKQLGYSGNAIVHVPLHLFESQKAKKLCLLAIQNGTISVLENISLDYVDQEIQKCVYNKFSKQRFELKYVPMCLMTLELCECAVDWIGNNIFHVPKHFENQNLWFRAVKQNPLLLHFIPLKWMNEKICLTATKMDPRAIYLLDIEFQTEQVCKNAEKAWVLVHPEKRVSFNIETSIFDPS